MKEEMNMKDQEVQPISAEGGDPNDPKIQEIIKKAKGYETVLMNLIHGDQTKAEVVNMLKAGGDPMVSVPQAAMTINDMGINTMKQGGVTVEPSVQMVASAYLIDDLLNLGQAAKAFEFSEDMIPSIMEDTYQMYVERGLKDKSIDPIQLQLEAEKAMDEKQIAGGLSMGAGKVPQKPSQQAMTQQYADQQTHQKVSGMEADAAKKQGQQKQQALSQAVMQQGGPENG